MAQIRQTPAPLTPQQIASMMRERARRSRASLPRGDLAGSTRRAVLVRMKPSVVLKQTYCEEGRISREKAVARKFVNQRKRAAVAEKVCEEEYSDEEDISVNMYPTNDPRSKANKPMYK